MGAYLRAFESNDLPIPALSCALVWCLLYAVAQFLAWRSARLAESSPQMFILVGGPAVPIKKQSWILMCVQLALSAAIFVFGYILGPHGFAFFAGGWVVATAASIPLTLRKVLFHRALLLPGAAAGSVTLSSGLAVKSAAFELLGLAAFVTVLGVCLAHLALLGGALFIGATACGYLRKATASEVRVVTTQQAGGVEPPPRAAHGDGLDEIER